MTAIEKANKWLESSVSEDFKVEVQRMINEDPALLDDAFYKDLEFGTGGMRGVMGVGSNRVNKYTFGMATQGLANYLKQSFPDQNISVAIAYDCRHNSQRFARLVAEILSANGIQVHLFEDLRPTPELSFAVRALDCQSGIVITASHNPPEYNGYKVYWSDGAQIVSPQDKGIIDEVRKIDSPDKIKFDGNDALINNLGAAMDNLFMKASLAQRLQTSTNKDLKIVVTSLHGTSITILPELLKRAGYENVFVVEEQAIPDGDFPTVKSPNPEEREALSMALEYAEKLNADMVIGTDPDSDRLGVAVRGNDGEMMLLNGNQTGVILTEYLLANRTLKGDEFIGYTIVSSDMFAAVAGAYNVESKVCLTGFKHIAKLIRDAEGEKTFVGGGEESYGFMIGDFVRDKDALTSTLLFCDWLGDTLSNGTSAEDALIDLYRRHGLYQEHLISITKKGKEGSEEIARMMESLRNDPPSVLAGEKITLLDDIQKGVSRNLENGMESGIDLPSSNVLQFKTASGSKISARPSGTEPKIKFYFSIRREWDDSKSLKEQQKILNDHIEAIIEDLNLK